MLEELVALAILEDRQRRLRSVVLVGRGQFAAPASGRMPGFADRLRSWLAPRQFAAIVPVEVRVEAEAWRVS